MDYSLTMEAPSKRIPPEHPFPMKLVWRIRADEVLADCLALDHIREKNWKTIGANALQALERHG